MAKARAIPDLSPEDAYAAAAAKILAVRSQELVDHSGGVLDMDDVERVHAMRVATRRLRAALEIFEPCFPSKARKAVLADVKELADALGERRDRDVAIGSLVAFSESIPSADRRGVSTLVDVLRLEQARANEALRPHVAADRITALHERLGGLISAAEAEASAESIDVAEVLARHSAGNGAGAVA